MTSQIEMHIGKNKLTEEFLLDIRRRFENKGIVSIKVSVLKSARESKDDVKKYVMGEKASLKSELSQYRNGFTLLLLIEKII